MKLRLLLALLSLAAAGAVFYVRAANNSVAATTSAPTAASTESCSDCDGPSPASVLPNPFKTDATTPATAAAPVAPAKN